MAFVAAIGLWRGGEADSREHGSALASGSDPQIGQECLVFGGIWAGVADQTWYRQPQQAISGPF